MNILEVLNSYWLIQKVDLSQNALTGGIANGKY